jgi:prepilin-type N-terminal cleavage/methylation domain-containing protein
MRKNSGFSLLELIVTLGLFSIFSLLISPLLKVSNTLNNSIAKQSLFEKDSAKIISLIEKSIKDSNIIKGNYIGKEYVKNGAIVLQYDKEIYLGLTENFFKNKTSKGNTLFLEYPVSDGKNIFYSFIIFRFYYGELQVIECKKINNEVYVENKNTILENIYGYFEKIENGIVIEMEILDSDFLKARSLKGYANFKKEIEK